MPSDNKPLPEPVLTLIFDAISPQWVNTWDFKRSHLSFVITSFVTWSRSESMIAARESWLPGPRAQWCHKVASLKSFDTYVYCTKYTHFYSGGGGWGHPVHRPHSRQVSVPDLTVLYRLTMPNEYTQGQQRAAGSRGGRWKIFLF